MYKIKIMIIIIIIMMMIIIIIIRIIIIIITNNNNNCIVTHTKTKHCVVKNKNQTINLVGVQFKYKKSV